MDKSAHQRRIGGPFVPPEFKSRLTARGDLEGLDGIRSDSPTAETESHHLLFSWAASNKLRLKTGDISNAYFQGEELDRLLLLKPPKGIPDPDCEGRRSNDLGTTADLRSRRCRKEVLAEV